MIEIFLKCISGIDDLKETVPSDISGEEVYRRLIDRMPPVIHKRSTITLINGSSIRNYKHLTDITNGDEEGFIDLQLRLCLCGGKGGFGQLLRTEGNKVSKSRRNNQEVTDNYRTLEGRRVRNVRVAEKLEEYLSKQSEDNKKALEQKREKLVAIINSDPLKNVRFDDSAYLDTSERIVDEIKQSVDFVMESDFEEEDKEEEEEEEEGEEKEREQESAKRNQTSQSAKPRFASFFGESDDESEK